MILPAMMPLLPLDVLTSNAVPSNSSFITEASFKYTNAAAGTQVLCTVNKGLWTFDIDCAFTSFDNGGVYTGDAVQFTLDYQGYAIRLCGESNWLGTLQKSKLKRTFTVLLREDDVTITVRWAATGIADTVAALISLIGTKHL